MNNPYLHLIKLGFVETRGALNRPVKVGNRNKKDDKGNVVYKGGDRVSVFALGANLEVHVEHDKNGNHLLSLFDVVKGESSQKIPYNTVKTLKLLEKQAKGQNVWAAFNG